MLEAWRGFAGGWMVEAVSVVVMRAESHVPIMP